MTYKRKTRAGRYKYTEELFYWSNEDIEEQFAYVEVPDYGFVQVNNLGTKFYTKTGKFPSISIDDWGYLGFQVGSTMDGIHKYHYLRLSRLVAMAFIPNPDNLPEVNHIDGDKLNNCVTNLEWCSSKQNARHAWDTGLQKFQRGEQNGRSKLTDEQIREIRKKYTGEKGQIANLAREYNVSWTLIKLIVTNKNWTHVL